MNVTREKSALLSWETRGDDAERLAVWLTTFLGEDVFRRCLLYTSDAADE